MICQDQCCSQVNTPELQVRSFTFLRVKLNLLKKSDSSQVKGYLTLHYIISKNTISIEKKCKWIKFQTLFYGALLLQLECCCQQTTIIFQNHMFVFIYFKCYNVISQKITQVKFKKKSIYGQLDLITILASTGKDASNSSFITVVALCIMRFSGKRVSKSESVKVDLYQYYLEMGR